MRRPPSLARLPAYPVAGGLGLMATLVTLMTGTGRWPLERFDISPAAFRGEPWRLFTATLPHVNALHLLFNVYWLWVFGTLLEEVLGHARLLVLVALLAAGSGAADYALSSGGVGLSGVGFGLCGMLWVLSREERFAGAVDGPTVQIFAGWFLLCVGATFLRIWPVANVAHAAGALIGVLVGAAMSVRFSGARRFLAAAGVPAVVAASLAGATVLRTRVNLSRDAHRSFQLGYVAIQEGRLDDAIRDYEEALTMNDQDAVAWHNLGVALVGAGRVSEAARAYRRSYDIDPLNLQHRSVYLVAARQAAFEAQERDDHAGALAHLRDVVAIDPDDAATWLLLERSYAALGDEAEAGRARERAATLAPKP